MQDAAQNPKTPNVALLASTPNIETRLPTTVEAAAVCKMADRGQILNATVEGPITYDMAISELAAERKGVYSPVCGATDIAVCQFDKLLRLTRSPSNKPLMTKTRRSFDQSGDIHSGCN